MSRYWKITLTIAALLTFAVCMSVGARMGSTAALAFAPFIAAVVLVPAALVWGVRKLFRRGSKQAHSVASSRV